MKEQELVKLEFLMKVNDNIIVQRFFNVRDYNPDARNSVELYDYIKDLKEELQEELKIKAIQYLLDNKFDISHNPSILNTSYIDGPEFFHIFLKENDVTICHRRFDAKIFPPKVRYTVDISGTSH
jgi:hypothetical protein